MIFWFLFKKYQNFLQIFNSLLIQPPWWFSCLHIFYIVISLTALKFKSDWISPWLNILTWFLVVQNKVPVSQQCSRSDLCLPLQLCVLLFPLVHPVRLPVSLLAILVTHQITCAFCIYSCFLFGMFSPAFSTFRVNILTCAFYVCSCVPTRSTVS